MIMYLQVKTKVPDLRIELFKMRLKSGEIVTVDWDESELERESDGFNVRYKGVYFDDEYANGRLEEIDKPDITSVKVSSELEEKADLVITDVEIMDGKKFKTFKTSYVFEGVECDE